jgi:heme-degrading monooxygenase HmoA
MHARVTRLEALADLLEEVTRQFEERTLALLEGLAGFEGYVLLADGASGQAMAITYWQSEEDLRASEEAGARERERAAETGGVVADPVVERYAVVSSS